MRPTQQRYAAATGNVLYNKIEWMTAILAHLEPEKKHMPQTAQRFVTEIAERFEKYRNRTYLSVAQKRWLVDLHSEHCAGQELPE